MYRIYVLKNSSGKIVYVGYTSQKLCRRLSGHKRFPERKQLTIHLLMEEADKEKAKSLEIRFQKMHNTLHPNGLNLVIGHINNDGRKLSRTGFKTRFGNRRKYPGEEAKRVKNHVEGIKRLRKKIRCINNGRTYESLGIASEELGLHRSAICRQLKGQQPHTGGYQFEYVPSINSL